MVGISDLSMHLCLLGVLSILFLHILAPLGVVVAREGSTILFQRCELLREQLLAGHRGKHAVVRVDFHVKVLLAALTAQLGPC